MVRISHQALAKIVKSRAMMYEDRYSPAHLEAQPMTLDGIMTVGLYIVSRDSVKSCKISLSNGAIERAHWDPNLFMDLIDAELDDQFVPLLPPLPPAPAAKPPKGWRLFSRARRCCA